MKLVVGLGNPGARYKDTRHNIGFLIVDHIAAEQRVAVNKKLRDARLGEWSSNGETVVLVKPQTYMNRSGECVTSLLRQLHASVSDLVVVHDDLDLPFGRIRVRARGGAAGHRGVLSILEMTAGAPFCRVRVGIGRPPDGLDPADFVLQPFSSDEAAQLDQVVARAAAAVTSVLHDGIQRAMEQFNRAPAL